MKQSVLAVCLLVSMSWAEAADVSVIKGEVLEVKDVPGYTYLRLKTGQGETWAAVNRAEVKKGAAVVIENAMTMDNFESKSLKKTFKHIVFGSLAGASAKTDSIGAVRVDKASGENAYTVAEIIGRAAALKDKPVLLRGQVVKYNGDIMGRNWLHLRDGSGSAADNDILVTSAQAAKLGEVVTVKGVVRNDKDFGSGYRYAVMIEDATLQP